MKIAWRTFWIAAGFGVLITDAYMMRILIRELFRDCH